MDKQIILTVLRHPSEADWTLSEFHILGVKRGVGVEDEKRAKKVHGETRIDNGIYEFTFEPSPKFSKFYYSDVHGNLSKVKDERFNTPHLLLTLLNVPNFSRVLWHWGNTDDDTEGCYIVGTNFGMFAGQKGVENSRTAYVRDFYPEVYQLWRKYNALGVKVYVEYKDK